MRVALIDPPELRETLVGLRLSRGPGAEEVAVSETVPANPPKLDRLIVTVPEDPRVMLSEFGFTVKPKSCTFTEMDTECTMEPLKAVTTTE